MRHRLVCFRSSPQHVPDLLIGGLFPQLFTTTPFERSSTRRFEACSCKPTSEGLLPSLVQHRELALAFVTHPARQAAPTRKQIWDGIELGTVCGLDASYSNLRAVYAEASQSRQGAVTSLGRHDSRIQTNVVLVVSGCGEYRTGQDADMFAEGGAP
jgi:hypothetical protein